MTRSINLPPRHTRRRVRLIFVRIAALSNAAELFRQSSLPSNGRLSERQTPAFFDACEPTTCHPASFRRRAEPKSIFLRHRKRLFPVNAKGIVHAVLPGETALFVTAF